MTDAQSRDEKGIPASIYDGIFKNNRQIKPGNPNELKMVMGLKLKEVNKDCADAVLRVSKATLSWEIVREIMNATERLIQERVSDPTGQVAIAVDPPSSWSKSVTDFLASCYKLSPSPNFKFLELLAILTGKSQYLILQWFDTAEEEKREKNQKLETATFKRHCPWRKRHRLIQPLSNATAIPFLEAAFQKSSIPGSVELYDLQLKTNWFICELKAWFTARRVAEEIKGKLSELTGVQGVAKDQS
ncbi:Homeobox domain-containing protein [Caenorhabditis elegans]|uniref:Homeobox domain-containing protein n=1 Tax=Caenorhabditis elegans TaxID=6239 RepID=O16748_CAEEL|nr:Homeobox domain-containing protein [Caenorhabditis elegans]CCD71251.1 Homeobox domain-containing protein [Caenorhabditis elegans]|eukprot:NP_494061.2 C. Elegans Homeobox [Caenorhabditis elegans]